MEIVKMVNNDDLEQGSQTRGPIDVIVLFLNKNVFKPAVLVF
jgi:hypothetical protein